MIQFKRGSTKNWRNLKKPLAAGQPGYDKEKHKIKVGDGESSWGDLPYASGLSAEEILGSEAAAKIKSKLDIEDKTIITYGTEVPDKNTVGQLYLQYYDTEPEVDYVVGSGVDGIWTYQIWKSGIAKCWGSLSITTSIQNSVGNGCLFNNENTLSKIKYPFTFSEKPSEVATISSAKNKVAWLACVEPNSKSSTCLYTILSYDKQSSATYELAFAVSGHVAR